MPCALVLSAGGLYCAYQAGAWKALAPLFQPDMVVGASAGALNAWAIAGGCSPAELISAWMDPSTAGLMRLRFPFPTLFDPAPLARRIHDDFVRFPPRVPCAVTMVEVPRLRRVYVADGQITPAHLMASCAVPCGYPPVRIGGRFYVDGGLLDAIPVWAAVALGATRVVVLNALPSMPSALMRWGVGLVRAIAPRFAGAAPIERVDIRPAAPLGPVRDAVTWKEANIRRWIEQGEAEAAAAVERGLFPGEASASDRQAG